LIFYDINQLNPEYLSQLGSGRVNAAQAVLDATMRLKNRRAQFAFAQASGGKPIVSITDSAGNAEKEFLAYKESFLGGLNLAAGDFNGDGNQEIVTAPAKDLEANIKIFNNEGILLHSFLAYPYTFRGGVNVTTADVDSDGKAEIITSPKSGFEPLVKIYKSNGQLVRSFLAYPASFKGGVSVTVSDVRDDKKVEIITAPGKGGIPQIKIFSQLGILLNSFLIGKVNENYGFNLATGDLDGNPRRRQAEIIISRQSGPPIVASYDFRGNKRRQWSAYLPPFNGNVGLMAADLNRDGFTDIITIPASSGDPHVRIFNYQGNFDHSFYASSLEFNHGIVASVFLTNN
jgi:fibronectin-binding autotransporter adhesin